MVVDPLICNSCSTNLQISYDFKKLCLNTEEKLKVIMEKSPGEGNIDLEKFFIQARNPKQYANKKVKTPNRRHLKFKRKRKTAERLKYNFEIVFKQTVRKRSKAQPPPNAKEEIIIEDYSELRNILQNHPIKQNTKVQSVIINIKGDNTPPDPLKKELDRSRDFNSTAEEDPEMEYEETNAAPDTETEEAGISSQEVKEEDLDDETVSQNFILCIEVGQASNETYMCKICTKKVHSRGAMRLHLLSHQKSENFACEVCDRKFKAVHYLKRHERTHMTHSALYKCSQCDKTFKDKWSFKKHSHDGMRNFLLLD